MIPHTQTHAHTPNTYGLAERCHAPDPWRPELTQLVGSWRVVQAPCSEAKRPRSIAWNSLPAHRLPSLQRIPCMEIDDSIPHGTAPPLEMNLVKFTLLCAALAGYQRTKRSDGCLPRSTPCRPVYAVMRNPQQDRVTIVDGESSNHASARRPSLPVRPDLTFSMFVLEVLRQGCEGSSFDILEAGADHPGTGNDPDPYESD